MLAHTPLIGFFIGFFVITLAQASSGFLSSTTHDNGHFKPPAMSNGSIDTENICGIKGILKTSDNKSILIATLQFQDHCALSVVYTDFQPSTDQVPSLYSTHIHSVHQKHWQDEDTDLHKLRHFSELSSEQSFIRCIANITNNSTSLAELQQPLIWSTILSQLATVTDHLEHSYENLTPQRHFPEDIKARIDSKRWIHLVSLLVLAKDIVEHNIAFINDTSSQPQNSTSIT